MPSRFYLEEKVDLVSTPISPGARAILISSAGNMAPYMLHHARIGDASSVTRPLRSILSISLLLLLHSAGSLAATTNGPLAAMTIYDSLAYKTARGCAANCLVYNGPFACGVNRGYYDLGVFLACPCGPNNACWCSKPLGQSVTSYISSCVSAGCAKAVADWPAEVTNMLSLYDGYCATANVAVAEVPAMTTATNAPKITTASTSAGRTGPVTAAGSTQTTSPPSSTTTTPPPAEGDKGGLSQSDIVALAASLGVGIPSLLIAGLTLCVMLRKRRRARAKTAKSQEGPYTPPVQGYTPQPQYQTRSHVSELDSHVTYVNPGYYQR
jgi:hypothetical protein